MERASEVGRSPLQRSSTAGTLMKRSSAMRSSAMDRGSIMSTVSCLEGSDDMEVEGSEDIATMLQGFARDADNCEKDVKTINVKGKNRVFAPRSSTFFQNVAIERHPKPRKCKRPFTQSSNPFLIARQTRRTNMNIRPQTRAAAVPNFRPPMRMRMSTPLIRCHSASSVAPNSVASLLELEEKQKAYIPLNRMSAFAVDGNAAMPFLGQPSRNSAPSRDTRTATKALKNLHFAIVEGFMDRAYMKHKRRVDKAKYNGLAYDFDKFKRSDLHLHAGVLRERTSDWQTCYHSKEYLKKKTKDDKVVDIDPHACLSMEVVKKLQAQPSLKILLTKVQIEKRSTAQIKRAMKRAIKKTQRVSGWGERKVKKSVKQALARHEIEARRSAYQERRSMFRGGSVMRALD